MIYVESSGRGAVFPIWGLAGSAVACVAAILAALPYHGLGGEAYSPFNHFISELGELGVSRLAPLFNAGLIVTGILLAGFMLGLGAHIGSVWGYLAAAVGVLASGACSLVGVFPMNHIEPHMLAAMSFFRFGMVAIALFSLAIVLDRKGRLPRWLALPGALTALTFAAFMYAPSEASSSATTQALHAGLGGRPDFWLMAALEWAVFVAVVGWVTWVSLYVRRKDHPQISQITQMGSGQAAGFE